jgi:hydrogenase maturation protease
MVLPAVADLMVEAGGIAVIACGNANRRDDGAGGEVLRLLKAAADPLPAAVRLLDAGTDGMAVMFAAKGCRSLILVDACRSGSESGAVFEVPGSELEQPPRASFNLHDFRWDNALYAGRNIFREAFPSDVTVFLIEAEALDLGIGLTDKVSAATRTVAVRIRRMIGERQDAIEEGQP